MEHRAEELKAEAASLHKYIEAHRNDKKPATRLAQCYQRLLSFPGTASDAAAVRDPLHCRACQRTFAKDTVFKAHLTGKKHLGALKGSKRDAAKALPGQLTAALAASYGLEACLWQVCQEQGAGAKDDARRAHEVPRQLAATTSSWEMKVDTESHIDFAAVFGASDRCPPPAPS